MKTAIGLCIACLGFSAECWVFLTYPKLCDAVMFWLVEHLPLIFMVLAGSFAILAIILKFVAAHSKESSHE